GLGRLLVLPALGQHQPARAAREERRRDLVEVRAHGRERVGEAALDGLGQLRAQLLELGEALLEVLALQGELLQPLLLGLVLLLGERVDAAERLEPALVTLELGRELVAVLSLCRLCAGRLETTP